MSVCDLGACGAGKRGADGGVVEVPVPNPRRPGKQPGMRHAAGSPGLQKGCGLIAMADHRHGKSAATSAAIRAATVSGAPAASIARQRSGSASRRCRSEEHTSELQSLMRISYAVFCLKKKKKQSSIKNNDTAL